MRYWVALIIPIANLFAACSSPPSAQAGISPSAMAASTPTPSAAVANRPPARFGGAMAYDEANQTAVLFGGQGQTGYLNDTWTWNGTAWTEQHPQLSPPARYTASMAYDATTKDIVVVGGIGNVSSSQIGNLGDTWTWNGTTWTEQHPAVSPPPRRGSSLAYDAASRQVILFGGDNGARVPLLLNDTWGWNGTTWAQRNPASSPPGRADASMAYDEAASQLVLFGGTGAMALGDTWIWDGRNWTQQAPSLSPSARYAAAAGYSASDGRVVLFGGYSGFSGTRLNETWAWNGHTWNQLHPSNQPPARVYPSISRGPAGSVLLFGGSGDAFKGMHGELNDTWSWHDAGWIPTRG
jgi:hypothetical protein